MESPPPPWCAQCCAVAVYVVAFFRVVQATGKMSTHELLKGLTALREKVDPSVLEQTLIGTPAPRSLSCYLRVLD